MLFTIPEIIEKSWLLYFKHFKELALYVILFFLLTPLFSLFFLTLVGIDGFLIVKGAGPGLLVPANIILGLALFIAALLIYFFVFAGFCQHIRHIFSGKPAPRFFEGLMLNRGIVVSTCIVAICVALVVLGGSILFIIPGLIFTIWYVFSVNEAIFNGQTGGQAMRASKKLVAGRWWAIFGRVVVPPFFFVVCAILLQFVIAWTSYLFFSQGAADTITSITSAVLNALLIPLLTVCNLVLYFSAQESAPASISSSTN